jgi:hypothetical protein
MSEAFGAYGGENRVVVGKTEERDHLVYLGVTG